jgi:hypothetical protein
MSLDYARHSSARSLSSALGALILVGCSGGTTAPNGTGSGSGSGSSSGGSVSGTTSGVGSGGVTGSATGGTGASSDAAVRDASDAGLGDAMDGASGSSDAGDSGGLVVGSCTPPADIFKPIAKLSQTGCMDPNDPTKPAQFVHPYEINSPQWADSADKLRAFVLPAGGKIQIKDCSVPSAQCKQGPADTGEWVFPAGTVFIQSFVFPGGSADGGSLPDGGTGGYKLVETRLLMRLDHVDPLTMTDWIGYSYQWNEQQTEATLVPDMRAEVMFNTGKQVVDWHYPSRSDCLNCHNLAAGSSLGTQTEQMNRVLTGETENQIDKFARLMLFDKTPAKPYPLPLPIPYKGQAGNPTGTPDQQARSYMAANCAPCHRPDGNYTSFDLRYNVAFKDMSVCNTPTQNGIGTLVLIPGDPVNSSMIIRMSTPDPNNGRMPKVSSYVVDTQGTALVTAWIKAIKTCPPGSGGGVDGGHD